VNGRTTARDARGLEILRDQIQGGAAHFADLYSGDYQMVRKLPGSGNLHNDFGRPQFYLVI